MQFLSYATLTLPKWLGTLNKLTLTLKESKTMPLIKEKEKEIKIGNTHMWLWPIFQIFKLGHFGLGHCL